MGRTGNLPLPLAPFLILLVRKTVEYLFPVSCCTLPGLLLPWPCAWCWGFLVHLEWPWVSFHRHLGHSNRTRGYHVNPPNFCEQGWHLRKLRGVSDSSQHTLDGILPMLRDERFSPYKFSVHSDPRESQSKGVMKRKPLERWEWRRKLRRNELRGSVHLA